MRRYLLSRTALPIAVSGLLLTGGSAAAAEGISPHARATARLQVSASVRGRYVGTGTVISTWGLSDVAMASPSVGWALAGDPRTAVEEAVFTTDGGRTFQKAFVPAMRPVAVAAPQPRAAFFLESTCSGLGCSSALQAVVGGSQAAPRTVWQSPNASAVALSFPTTDTGFIAATVPASSGQPAGRIFATVDGGTHWSALAAPCPDVSLIAFVDGRNGWLLCQGQQSMSGATKALYATSDGGRRWVETAASGAGMGHAPLPYAGDATGLFLASRGYLAVDGVGLLRSGDGGKTWQPVAARGLPQGPLSNFASFGILPGGFGWAVGAQSHAATSEAYTFLLFETEDAGLRWRAVYPPTLPFGATVSDLGGGAALGVGGTLGSPWQLIVSRDGGRTWTTAANLPFEPSGGISAFPHGNLVALGTNEQGVNILERSRNRGTTWSAEPTIPSAWLGREAGFSAPDMGWVTAAARVRSSPARRRHAPSCRRHFARSPRKRRARSQDSRSVSAAMARRPSTLPGMAAPRGASTCSQRTSRSQVRSGSGRAVASTGSTSGTRSSSAWMRAAGGGRSGCRRTG